MKKHKNKAIGAGLIALAIVILQAWPMICPLLPGNMQCDKTQKLAEFGVTKLQEAQDAGTL